MNRFLYCLLALLLLAGVVSANDYRVVVASQDGYVRYQGGDLWWRGGSSYTYIPPTRYYSNGCYYWSPGEYKLYYTPPTYVQPAYVAPQPPSVVQEDFDSKLLEYAKYQDTIAFRERALALVQNRAPRFNGIYSEGVQQYRYAPRSASLYTGGSTEYGYTLKEVTDLYGEGDLARFHQAQARLTERAQDYANQSDSRFNDRLSQATRVAEIIAEAKAAAIKLNAAKPQSSSRTETTITGKGIIQNPMSRADEGSSSWYTTRVETPVSGKLQNYVNSNCVSCHKPGGDRGQTDFTNLATAVAGLRYAATIEVGSGTMPKGGQAAPDEILEEFRLWAVAGKKAALQSR